MDKFNIAVSYIPLLSASESGEAAEESQNTSVDEEDDIVEE